MNDSSKKKAQCLSPDQPSHWPEWAQKEHARLHHTLETIRNELEQIKRAHHILRNRNQWIAIPGPKNAAENFSIFFRHGESFEPVCEVGQGDVLLIGRAEKSGQGM